MRNLPSLNLYLINRNLSKPLVSGKNIKMLTVMSALTFVVGESTKILDTVHVKV